MKKIKKYTLEMPSWWPRSVYVTESMKRCPAAFAELMSLHWLLLCSSAIVCSRSGTSQNQGRYREPEAAACSSWKVLSKQRFRSE